MAHELTDCEGEGRTKLSTGKGLRRGASRFGRLTVTPVAARRPAGPSADEDQTLRRGGIAMNARGQLARMSDHLEWSNRRVLQAVPEAEDERALRLLSHLLAAERVWLRRLETGDSSDLEIWPDLGLEACTDLLARNVEACRRHLRSMGPEDLDRRVTYRNSEGREFHTPAGEILLHVMLHGSYHRGQIALRLREAGEEPVNTDFITFVREEPGPRS